MRIVSSLALIATMAIVTPASAATVFYDGFEGDAPALTVTNLSNFTVLGGVSVDVVGSSNPYGITVSGPASGNVIDLDGTPGPASMFSNLAFSFNAGDVVTLWFDVGGAQRGSRIDPFSVGLISPNGPFNGFGNIFGTGLTTNPSFDGIAGVSSQNINILGNTPFTHSSIGFTALQSGSVRINFATNSNDNIGPLLDNVLLDISSSVPEPATWAMMIIGFGLIGSAMRRRVRQSVSYSFA